jgi:hypothetical protein
MSRIVSLMFVTVLAGLLLLGVVAVPAQAASRVGQHLGNELDQLARGLVFGVLVLTSLPIIMMRLWNQVWILMAVATPIGGMAFAPNTVEAIFRDVIGALSP